MPNFPDELTGQLNSERVSGLPERFVLVVDRDTLQALNQLLLNLNAVKKDVKDLRDVVATLGGP